MTDSLQKLYQHMSEKDDSIQELTITNKKLLEQATQVNNTPSVRLPITSFDWACQVGPIHYIIGNKLVEKIQILLLLGISWSHY